VTPLDAAGQAIALPAAPEPAPAPAVAGRPWVLSPGWLRDGAALLLMLGAAVGVFGQLWLDAATRTLARNSSDQMLFEWMLLHTARAVTSLTNPFFSPDLGAPAGANLIANTSMVLPGILLTPVTLLAGPAFSFAALVTLCLAGTAAAWYFFLLRRVVTTRPAAFAGAVMCGFGPGIVSQANGHPHMAAQFLIPILLAVSLRLGLPGRTVRNGVALGLLTAAQILIGEEILFIAVLAIGCFVLFYAVARPREVLPRLRTGVLSLLIGAAVALVLVGYPLWLQFFSQHAYHGLTTHIHSADLGSFTTYAEYSLAGAKATADRVSPNASEQAVFFGWPLLILLGVATWWLWRTVWLRVAALTALLFMIFSLGGQLQLQEKPLGLPGPWAVVERLPLFRDLITLRLGLVALPVAGLIIAASWQRAVANRAAGRSGLLRVVWPVALVAAIVPTLPVPVDAVSRKPLPAFITAGGWRECTDPGGTLVAYPDSIYWNVRIEQMTWQLAAGQQFAVPTGYYIARRPDGRAQWGQPASPTDTLVLTALTTGTPPVLTDAERAQARKDLTRQRADCIAIPADIAHAAVAASTVTALTGVEPKLIGGVSAWDLRRW
jgi:hypothetical protein